MATHRHWDHLLGRLVFPDAPLLVSPRTLAHLRAAPEATEQAMRDFDDRYYLHRPEPLRLADAESIPLPGASRSATRRSSWCRPPGTATTAWPSGCRGRGRSSAATTCRRSSCRIWRRPTGRCPTIAPRSTAWRRSSTPPTWWSRGTARRWTAPRRGRSSTRTGATSTSSPGAATPVCRAAPTRRSSARSMLRTFGWLRGSTSVQQAPRVADEHRVEDVVRHAARAQGGDDPAQQVVVAHAAVGAQLGLRPHRAPEHAAVAEAVLEQRADRVEPLGVGRVLVAVAVVGLVAEAPLERRARACERAEVLAVGELVDVAEDHLPGRAAGRRRAARAPIRRAAPTGRAARSPRRRCARRRRRRRAAPAARSR